MGSKITTRGVPTNPDLMPRVPIIIATGNFVGIPGPYSPVGRGRLPGTGSFARVRRAARPLQNASSGAAAYVKVRIDRLSGRH
jgi:hypothetical protein